MKYKSKSFFHVPNLSLFLPDSKHPSIKTADQSLDGKSSLYYIEVTQLHQTTTDQGTLIHFGESFPTITSFNQN